MYISELLKKNWLRRLPEKYAACDEWFLQIPGGARACTLLYSTSVVELLLLAADRDRAAFAALSAFASLLAELRLEDPLRCEGGGSGCRRPPAPPLFRRFSDLVAAGGSSISG